MCKQIYTDPKLVKRVYLFDKKTVKKVSIGADTNQGIELLNPQ